ncbi:TIM barrel protein [Phycicoccus flavus]|uniref:TIM barrel protein n=1 Tax=Phycicoccus flavus TaxID=2502783 RepID=A0A8T6R1V4_9MICO|nr:TIM barrel protein [Phycicoccus flavus]NHA67732.1 TIM barrel protein [Phycicoccus flavus]
MFLDRVASAPISWGICEVPGWGKMLPTDRVLTEMTDLGITATEYGAPGFLPVEPDAVREVLGSHGMSLLGGFTPLVLHDPARRDDELARVQEVAGLFGRAGASTFVSCPVMDDDWSVPRPLDRDEHAHLVRMLGEVDTICADAGLTQVLHPHLQTVVETSTDVERVLDDCDVKWCLDTGHLAIGGTDPVDFARRAAERVGHVHLKDVRMDLVPRLMDRSTSIMAGVQEGLFPPLGQGDLPLAEVVRTLEASGYDGWYVIEQDTAITGPFPGLGEGPVTGVEASMQYLRDVVVPLLDEPA